MRNFFLFFDHFSNQKIFFRCLVLGSLSCLSSFAVSKEVVPQELSIETLPISGPQKKLVKDYEVVTNSQVETIKGEQIGIQGEAQTLKFDISGLHKKSCARALGILSRYESFKNHIDFIKESRYDEQKKEVYFYLSHTLMPFDMSLSFKIPRITGPGAYPFSFEQGFLKNLSGTIYVAEAPGRSSSNCLFFTTASWQGPYSKIPSPIFEMFSATLSRISMEKLFKISGSF